MNAEKVYKNRDAFLEDPANAFNTGKFRFRDPLRYDYDYLTQNN